MIPLARTYINGREHALVAMGNLGRYAIWSTEEQQYVRRNIERQQAAVIASDWPYVSHEGAAIFGLRATA